jgi:hypothetical protein
VDVNESVVLPSVQKCCARFSVGGRIELQLAAMQVQSASGDPKGRGLENKTKSQLDCVGDMHR